jgi:hypothetical protein
MEPNLLLQQAIYNLTWTELDDMLLTIALKILLNNFLFDLRGGINNE